MVSTLFMRRLSTAPVILAYYERVNYKKSIFYHGFLQPRYHEVFKNSNSYCIRRYYHAKVQTFCWKGKRVWVGVFTGKCMPQISFCDVIYGSEEEGNPRTP